jgi:hypothetical protein
LSLPLPNLAKPLCACALPAVGLARMVHPTRLLRRVIVVWFLHRTARRMPHTSSTPPHRTWHTSWPVLDPSTTIFITVASFPTTKTTPLKLMVMVTPTRSQP